MQVYQAFYPGFRIQFLSLRFLFQLVLFFCFLLKSFFKTSGHLSFGFCCCFIFFIIDRSSPCSVGISGVIPWCLFGWLTLSVEERHKCNHILRIGHYRLKMFLVFMSGQSPSYPVILLSKVIILLLQSNVHHNFCIRVRVRHHLKVRR